MTENRAHLPLAGICVIDFGQQIAAPAAAMILADLGATVIHIDPPGGAEWDHPANAILNRNKQCLQLDLTNEAGHTQALALINKADIVIANQGEIVARLDFDHLRTLRPQLITLSIPAFASNDELRRDWKATEAIIAASGGAFTDMGFNRVLMGLNPSFSPLPLGSSYTATLAATSAMLVLYGREKTGRGDAIEIPIISALMEGLSYNSYLIDGLPDRYKTMREHEIEYRKTHNLPMDVSYEELQEYLDPFYRTYECADGRLFYCVCPSHRNHAKRALQALGIYDALVAEGLPEVSDLHAPISEWDGETSIGVYPLPKKWADHIATKMKPAFLQKTSDEWGVIFGEKAIPGAPHRTLREWLHDPHSRQAGLVVEVADPIYGKMLQAGPILWLEDCAEIMTKPQPRREVRFDEALASLEQEPGLERGTCANSVKIPASEPIKKGWLEGVKILDLTNVIAGSHAGAFLSRFGAEIIKLDPVTPLYDPLIGTLFHFQTGMGKRSVLIDIMTEEGREIFNRLLKSSDVVIINAPQRQLQALGLDEERLKDINPDIIFSWLDCFGGPREGYKSNYIGYDDIVQADSGIMSRFGGEATPEEHAHLGALDVNCGFAAAASIACALYRRRKEGKTSRARTSLAAVTNLAQLPFAFDYQNRPPFDEPSGREVLGYHALSHFYKSADGWIYLDSSRQEMDALAKIEGLAGIDEAGDIGEFLRHALSKQPSNFWVEKLQAAGIAACAPQSIEALRETYLREGDNSQESGIERSSFSFVRHRNHPSGYRVTQIDAYAIRPREAAIIAPSLPERWGHSTRQILSEIGLSAREIDGLIERKIASLGWAREFLPS